MHCLNKCLGIAAVCVVLSACGDAGPAQGSLETASRSLRPADAALAETYDRSCRSCHTIAATGAPLTGDQAAWASRLDKGFPLV